MKLGQPIAIIGAGCVLPGAGNTEAFWKILCEGNDQFRTLPQYRLSPSIFLDSTNKSVDTTYSTLAAFVDDEIFYDEQSSVPRGHQMVLKALREAVHPLGNDFFKTKRVAVVLGCMNPEDKAASSLIFTQKKELVKSLKERSSEHFDTNEFSETFDRLFRQEQDCLEIHFPSSLSFYVHQELGTKGLSFCADSACASSLTAIDLTSLLLESGEVDVVITGGVEANLGVETYVPFRHLGVLARKNCLPYDSRSEGIVQGEGAVIFVCERLSDVEKESQPVLGVIEGITSSSNGAKASLFSPSFESQQINFQNLEKELGGQPPLYIEGHGTGTPVGDEAELKALTKAFAGSPQKIYLGSVKSLIGHTKGTAGAAGILKCLLMMKYSCIPPSHYFQKANSRGEIGSLEINVEGINLKNQSKIKRMRVCSSGFGGANYYLALTEYEAGTNRIKATSRATERPVIIAFSEVPFKESVPKEQMANWKISPHLFSELDQGQISALHATELALDKSLISKSLVSSLNTCIITASHTRTDKIEKLMTALQLKKMLGSGLPWNQDLQNYRDSLVKWDETTCQSLNSMISGRISNAFDCKGINFHLDADFASLGYALAISEKLLTFHRSDMVMILSVEEIPQHPPSSVLRKSTACWLLTSQELAREFSLPQLRSLDEVSACL